MYCHLHPHKIARRKCRHCRQPLCPRCQIIDAGIIFCSSWCRWSYFLKTSRQIPSTKQLVQYIKTTASFLERKATVFYQKIKPILSFLDQELSYGEEWVFWELKASRDSIKIFWALEKEGLRRIISRAKKSLPPVFDFLMAVSKGLVKGLLHVLRTQWFLVKGFSLTLYTFLRLLLAALSIFLGDFVPWAARKIYKLIYEYIDSKYAKYRDYSESIKIQWWARVFARALLVILLILVFSLTRSVMKAHKIYEDLTEKAVLALNSSRVAAKEDKTRHEIPPPEPETPKPVKVSTAKPAISPLLSYPPDVVRVSTQEKILSFTFDGGAEANVTQEILDTLKAKGLRATIFLTGEYMKKYPYYVQRMVQDGHEIGNHTMTHPHLTTYARNYRHDLLPHISKQYFQQELIQANQVFKGLVGKDLWPYWRAPYGEHNPTLRAWAQELGYQHISWTVDYQNHESMDSVDWVADKDSRLYRSSKEIKQRLVSFGERNGQGAKGGIILMHLGTLRQDDRVHEHLGEIIDVFRERGYRLVTVNELLEKESSLKTALKRTTLGTP